MKIDCAGTPCHLTYCSNIHPGESWPEVREIVSRYLPQVKREVSPDAPMGVGLRVSGQAAFALAEPSVREDLLGLLETAGLYVFTLNGFPYGKFHGTRVKEDVYLPDWRDAERLRYTNVLADLMAELVPDEPGLIGTISTVPGAFKSNASSPAAVVQMREMMVEHVAHLVSVQQRTGRTIQLALEPEPCCFLETIAESVAFFEGHLFSTDAVNQLARLSGLSTAQASDSLRSHLGLCLDLCHAAVEFEDVDGMLAALSNAGIAIAKIQVSSGLRFPSISARTRELLEPFDDDVYLHQVVERRAGELRRFTDLSDAFATLGPASESGDAEWRVHCHVPLFLDDMGEFSSTQAFVREVLERHRQAPLSAQLEVETYTWGVLPEQYRQDGVVNAVVRELEWVLGRLSATN